MMTSPPTLHLIDGHSQVFRAYHAIQGGLSTETGLPTNAIFGFLMSLNAFLKSENPTHLIVTFDAGHAARSALYPDYKSNRAETPEDLVEQIPWIHRVLEAMGVTQARVDGEEADDLIATLTRQAREKNFDVVILSNDKDLFQLVDDHVTVHRTQPRGGIARCDAQAVREKLGVEPSQVAEYLGLMGDAVDCIPGVPGVGPKTAAKLLAEHGELEQVIAQAPNVRQAKLRENLIAHADTARLSHRLATLDDHTAVTFDPDESAWQLRPSPGLTSLLRELELTSLLDEWGEEPGPVETQVETLSDEASLAAYVDRVREAPLLAFDTETTGVDAMRADLVGISLSAEEGTGVYIPVGHVELNGNRGDQLSVDTVREILGPLMADPAVGKCGHHLKYDLKVLRRAGFDVRGIAFDTMLASMCLNPDKRGHGLKELSLERLGVRQSPISELIGTGREQITMAQVAVSDAADYAAADADLTLRLHGLLRRELEEADLLALFLEIELPLIEILADMEMTGVVIDTPHFERMGAGLKSRLAALTEEIHTLAGRVFNISSTPQLREVLFDDLGLPVLKKTKTGASTDVSVLEQLAKEHPLPAKILEHRSVEKLLSTYVDALPKLLNPETGRIHTHYSQTGAATGRLSSSDPNLQNIPVRTETGRRVREGFIPSDRGNVFLAADYSQIELRIAAHLSGDEALVEAFRRGDDIHRATAARVHGVDATEVTPEQRDAAKRVSFGILYGISAHRLSNELGIARPEAQAMIDQHFETFDGVSRWIEATLALTREQGYVTTLSGRRRFIGNIRSNNFNLRAAAERVAVNTPIQGSAADLIKIAMRQIAERLAAADLRARMVLQVHDELIFDLPQKEVETVRPLAAEIMAGAMNLSVPIVVDVTVGRTWADCKS